MGFSANAGPSRSRTSISEINVTPLVDVMLVLLIMFMVTAPLMQQGIQVELPKTASSGVELNNEPFVLVVEKSGQIKIGKSSIDPSKLRDKLKAIFSTGKYKQIYIQADKSANYGIVAEVIAEVKAAGISGIGLITVPKDN
ncbi:MAG: biopolymer transporter ExbD [Bdellovibrionaceae bacterium]|nr:biopolymer transporter ExbD [Pseudobdellovibrionaceae bacterium]